jgi:hypothetical protein
MKRAGFDQKTGRVAGKALPPLLVDAGSGC